MALPLPYNVKVDIYRHYDPAHPYPPADHPRFKDLDAHLRHHVKNGRFGFQARNLYWTHVLHLDPGIDLRSAYNSQLDPARDNNRADVVLVQNYPLANWCTAFYVVLVTRRNRGTPADHLMCYLDRFLPQTHCFPAPNCQACHQCGFPTTNFFGFAIDTNLGDGTTFTDGPTKASRFNGQWTLSHNGSCTWFYVGSNFRFVLFLDNPSATWKFQLYDAAVGVCGVTYSLPYTQFRCDSRNVFTNPVWDTGDGCGAGSLYPNRIVVEPIKGSQFCGCCAPVKLPNTLVWSNPGGSFPATDLTYDSSSQSWKGTNSGHPFCPMQPFTIEFSCAGDQYVCRANFTGLPADTCQTQAAAATCSPFLWQAGVVCKTCYSAGAALNFQVTQ